MSACFRGGGLRDGLGGGLRLCAMQYSILLVIIRERVAFFVRRAKDENAAKAIVYIKVSQLSPAPPPSSHLDFCAVRYPLQRV